MQTRVTHQGPVFNVEVMTWTDGQGRPVRRDVVRHPGAVLIIPVLDADRLVMIRNHRISVGARLLEFPAGKLESGELPIHAAGRELIEETGYQAATVEPLGRFYTTPGFSDELMHAFVATGLTPVKQRLEPGEEIQVEILPLDQALRLIDQGDIVDGKSIAGLLMWEQRNRQIGGEVRRSAATSAPAPNR